MASLADLADQLETQRKCNKCGEQCFDDALTHCPRCDIPYPDQAGGSRELRESTYDIEQQNLHRQAEALNYRRVATSDNDKEIEEADARADEDDEDFDERYPNHQPRGWRSDEEEVEITAEERRALMTELGDDDDEDDEFEQAAVGSRPPSSTGRSSGKRPASDASPTSAKKIKKEAPDRKAYKGTTTQVPVAEKTMPTKEGAKVSNKPTMRIETTAPVLVDPGTEKGKFQKLFMDELSEAYTDESGNKFNDRSDPEQVAAHYGWLLINYGYNMGKIYDFKVERKCKKDGCPFKYPKYLIKFMCGTDEPHEMPALFLEEKDFLRFGAQRKAEAWAWKYARMEAVGKKLDGKPWDELSAQQKERRIKKSVTDQMHGFTEFVDLLEKEKRDIAAAVLVPADDDEQQLAQPLANGSASASPAGASALLNAAEQVESAEVAAAVEQVEQVEQEQAIQAAAGAAAIDARLAEHPPPAEGEIPSLRHIAAQALQQAHVLAGEAAAPLTLPGPDDPQIPTPVEMNKDLVQVGTAVLGDPGSPSLLHAAGEMQEEEEEEEDDEYEDIPGQETVTETGADDMEVDDSLLDLLGA